MPRIKIDLNDLTQAQLDECRPHLGTGRYDAPCVIGTFLPKEVRDDPFFPQHSAINGNRIQKFVEVVPGQMDDLVNLQDAFDSACWFDVLAIASKYIKEPVS